MGEGEPRQIVCGAWNFGVGATVAVGLPGVLLPGFPAPLDERPLRGELSRGMILAEDEIGLGSDHAGIMLLPDGIEPGTPLADVLPVREQVLDATPTMNRVDLLSMVGLAREVATLCDGELIPIDVVDPPILHPQWVEVEVESPDACPRYLARVLSNVTIGPVADVAARAAPCCRDAVDLERRRRDQLRHARVRKPAARLRPLGRSPEGASSSGTRGPARRWRRSTERCDVSTSTTCSSPTARSRLRSRRSWAAPTARSSMTTTEVLLEAANFEPIGVLKTSERLGLRTEGSNRWEKGIDPYLAEPAAVLASRMIVDLAGAELSGSADVHGVLPARPVIRLRPERTERLVGLEIPAAEQRQILERLGFEVDDDWEVTVPTVRARDVTREIDLIEEVARIVLDRVPHTMPLRRSVAGHLAASSGCGGWSRTCSSAPASARPTPGASSPATPTRRRFACPTR